MGFARVDIRGSQLSVEICIRNNLRGNELGEVFVLVKPNNLLGIKIGEIKILGNQVDARFVLQKENIMESNYGFHDIVGIGIRMRNNGYLASCWNDEDTESVGSGTFHVYQKEVVEDSVMQAAQVEKETIEVAKKEPDLQIKESSFEREDMYAEEPIYANSDQFEGTITYRKLELDQIHSLPSSNWHLCNNSFLIHGFWSYGYLILKKKMEEDKEILWLGIPGFFEKPEMVMAVLFGFTEFEGVPQEVVELSVGKESIPYKIEKNQEPKTGLFGCWFVKLNG